MTAFAKTDVSLTDLSREIDADVDRLAEMRTEAVAGLIQVKNANQRRVLWEFYIYGKPTAQIAQEMGFTLRRIYQLKEEGLMQLDTEK